MAAIVVKKFNQAGTFSIFAGMFNLVTFAVIPSKGSIFTLATAIDPNGSLVDDITYNNYTNPIQDSIANPGHFAIKVINPGLEGIHVEFKTFV